MKKPKRRKLSKRKQELKDARAARRQAEAEASAAKSDAEWYKRRFRAFGSNVKTIQEGPGLKCIEWRLKPDQYGNYAMLGGAEYAEYELKRELVEQMAQGLIENNLVQFISSTPDIYEPFFPGTYAAKLFVVPWELAPHEREVRLRQYVRETLEEGEANSE